jgi:hypothetical protein
VLIGKPKRKWARDVDVADLVDYFDQFEQRVLVSAPNAKKVDLWAHLSPKEESVILSEIERCGADFSYAARNYFWIINKETKQDQLLKLWESQEYLLGELMRLRAMGRSQRIIIIKSRQLGMSTVAESLIAHRSFFSKNADSFIVSYDDDHAAYLFGIVLHIYDKLPWWMRPMESSREFKKGLILDNPEPDDRRLNPGLNSKITAKGAMAVTGVGQGRGLAFAHISEFADFIEDKAREIIEEDIENALVDSVASAGILETTPKGAGTYSHDLWLRMEKLGDRATWMPVYLPWFFDRSKRMISLPDWRPKQEEADIRTRAMQDWVRCDNAECEQFHRRHSALRDISGTTCRTCGTGIVHPHVVPSEQLAWMQWRREGVEGDEKSINKLLQEQSSTAEESFRVSGVRLFSQKAMAFAQNSIKEPLYGGFIDRTVRFHAVSPATGRCVLAGCEADHSYDSDDIIVWELPQSRCVYVVSGDVAEGLGGTNDYSVAQVIKVDKHGGADEQVAEFASNTIDPEAFADLLSLLGRLYNDALLASELNATAGGIVSHSLRVKLQYPNLYRPLRAAHINAEGGSLIGWKTTNVTKPTIYLAFRKALESRMLCVRCKFTVTEINNFRKDDQGSRSMGAMTGHDDRVMALMICYFVAHERDWDEDGGTVRYRTPLTVESAPYIFNCLGCGHLWPGATPKEYDHCPACGTMHVAASSQESPEPYVTIDTEPVHSGASVFDEDRVLPTYQEL